MAAPRIEVHDLAVPMPDGTKLATDLIVAPDGERHPVLLVRTPYARASLRGGHDPIGLARDGWAVVLQDVRGRVDSDGVFDAMAQERPDGAATVEWCAAQPWSNGRVAMLGASYNGYVQWAAARQRPKGLAAIGPMLTTPYNERTWFKEGGAFRFGPWATWSMAMATAGNKGTRAQERRALKAVGRWRELSRYPFDPAPIAEHFPAFADWYGADESYWRALDGPGTIASTVRVPGYHLAGWYDIFVEGSIEAYEELTHRSRSESVRRTQRLVVGPWGHTLLLLQVVGALDFGSEANWLNRGIPGEQLAFLREAAEGREPAGGASVFVMGRNSWLDLETWPPPTDEVAFHLESRSAANSARGDGRLLADPTDRAGSDHFRHDPTDPVPTVGGRHLLWDLTPAGPAEQTPVEQRNDVLVYTSNVLDRELTIAGAVRAELYVASTAPRTDVTVKLVDVHPDGKAYNVVDSIKRDDLTPGRTTRVTVPAGRTAQTFLRGHRIRVQIASSNAPGYDCLEAADQTVHWGGRTPSRVLLPVLR